MEDTHADAGRKWEYSVPYLSAEIEPVESTHASSSMSQSVGFCPRWHVRMLTPDIADNHIHCTSTILVKPRKLWATLDMCSLSR